MDLTYWDVVFGLVLTLCLGSFFSLVGVVVGGLFVFRTKRDAYEPLLPPLKDTKETVAVNIDDFEEELPLDNEALDSEIEKILTQRKAEDPINNANSKMKEQMNVFSK